MRILVIALMIFFVNGVAAQQLNSYVENGVAFINHTVIKGEGSFAIANIYGITLANLLKENNLQKDDVLQEGRQLKIAVSGHIIDACEGDSCIAVYYTVQQSEGLYRIGKNHGDIKIAQIKKLNHLTSESVSKGQQLLIGYFALAAKVINMTTLAPAAEKLSVEAVDENVDTASKQQPWLESTSIQNTKKQGSARKIIGDSALLTYKGSGAFAEMYKAGINQAIMNVAAFKSESGWADGKFYALLNGIEPGTVVEIKNPVNEGVIYAKVVGPLPQVKHAEEITIRISSAAMLTLGFFYDDFYSVQISY